MLIMVLASCSGTHNNPLWPRLFNKFMLNLTRVHLCQREKLNLKVDNHSNSKLPFSSRRKRDIRVRLSLLLSLNLLSSNKRLTQCHLMNWPSICHHPRSWVTCSWSRMRSRLFVVKFWDSPKVWRIRLMKMLKKSHNCRTCLNNTKPSIKNTSLWNPWMMICVALSMLLSQNAAKKLLLAWLIRKFNRLMEKLVLRKKICWRKILTLRLSWKLISSREPNTTSISSWRSRLASLEIVHIRVI